MYVQCKLLHITKTMALEREREMKQLYGDDTSHRITITVVVPDIVRIDPNHSRRTHFLDDSPTTYVDETKQDDNF